VSPIIVFCVQSVCLQRSLAAQKEANFLGPKRAHVAPRHRDACELQSHTSKSLAKASLRPTVDRRALFTASSTRWTSASRWPTTVFGRAFPTFHSALFTFRCKTALFFTFSPAKSSLKSALKAALCRAHFPVHFFQPTFQPSVRWHKCGTQMHQSKGPLADHCLWPD